MSPTAAAAGAGIHDAWQIHDQVWIDRWCLAVGGEAISGKHSRRRGLLADPGQRFLYVASRALRASGVLDRKTLQAWIIRAARHSTGEFDTLQSH